MAVSRASLLFSFKKSLFLFKHFVIEEFEKKFNKKEHHF